MLDEVGLIHMNGRIYDARLGRFVQADPNIDGATQIQGYARYSYVKNNPLNATDPSGFFIKSLLKDLASEPILNSIIQVAGCYAAGPVGCIAFSGIYSGMQSYAVTGDFGVSLKAGMLAVGSSGVAYGIGQANLSLTQAALTHGATQGFFSVMQGGKFGHGFASAFVSKIANVNQIQGDYKLTRVITASIIGGTMSHATGGKFVNGAVTAAYVQLLNGEAPKRKPKNFGEEYRGKKTFLVSEEWYMETRPEVIDIEEIISLPVLGGNLKKFDIPIYMAEISLLKIKTMDFRIMGLKLIEYYDPVRIPLEGSVYDLPPPMATGRTYNDDYTIGKVPILGTNKTSLGVGYEFKPTGEEVIWGD